MLKWVRSGVLAGARDLVADLGGDFRALANEASISSEAIRNPDTPIQAVAVARFLENAAAVLDCEAFGLRLGQLQDLSLFGPLWSFFQSATTVGELVHDLATYFPLHTQGAILAIAPAPHGVMLTYDVAADIAHARRQVVELGFGVLIGELRRHQAKWRPQEIFLRHAAPRDSRWHRRLLGPGVVFNADRNAMFVEQTFLRMPTLSGDRERHRRFVARFDKDSKRLQGMVRTRTETIVRALLPFAPCDLATTARMLGAAPRTLQRRLAAEDASFDGIVDLVRADLALSYLKDSRLTVAEVAEILQFSETSALSRACRRWHGASPRELRSDRRARK